MKHECHIRYNEVILSYLVRDLTKYSVSHRDVSSHSWNREDGHYQDMNDQDMVTNTAVSTKVVQKKCESVPDNAER